jgi:ceramide glucosyltransferase
MTFAVLIAIVGVVLLADIIWAHRQLVRAIRRQRLLVPRATSYPSISVIRPVRGHDVDADENFRAALDTGYPGEIETLFVFDDEHDPGLAPARAVVEEHRRLGRPGRAEVMVVGAPPPGRTGKLNAMIEGVLRARGELIAFGDSDTRPDREVLRATVDTLLASPRAGAAFAPVVVPGPARTAGDVGYAMLLNAWYGPSVAQSAGERGDVPFIMGQLMVFTRDCLRRIGGVGCAEGQLVDDMHIGACVARAGLRNVMSPHPLTIHAGGMSLYEFARLFRRWLLFSRNGLPSSFTWPMWQRGIEFWLAFAATSLALVTHHPTVALLPLVGLVAYGVSMSGLQRGFGGEPVRARWLWLPFVIPVIAPAVFLACIVRREVTWRGRAYALGTQARLA